MDKLREMLSNDPCYEQHIVSIKDMYEEYLFSIIIPAIYEGFQSLYKRAYDSELKFIAAAKRNPDIENPGILIIFQTLIKEIPNLNTHKIRTETDRIKSSSKSADIFDDLIKAVCKSNIILLTYNNDHKKNSLLQTKYHENIIIHDFIHSCYIHSARVFYGCAELFYHNQDPIILNKNKRSCFKIIRESIKEAIRLMLPMKEILLEYITQKYEQKDNHFANELNMYPKDNFMNINQMIERDNHNYNIQDDNHHYNIQDDNQSLLDDNDDYNPDNTFGQDIDHKNKDYSLLLSSDSVNSNRDTKSNSQSKDSLFLENNIEPEKKNVVPENVLSVSDHGLKMIDLKGTVTSKGSAAKYFVETMPEIKKRLDEYKKERKDKKSSSPNNEHKDDDIHITRIVSDKQANVLVNDLVNDVLKT